MVWDAIDEVDDVAGQRGDGRKKTTTGARKKAKTTTMTMMTTTGKVGGGRGGRGGGRGCGRGRGRGGRASSDAKKETKKTGGLGRKSAVVEVKNADEYGSSVAQTHGMNKATKEEVSELRSEWKFYALMTFVGAFKSTFRFPERSCKDWERALCDPLASGNEWIVETFIRSWAMREGDGDVLVVPQDWEAESMKTIRRLFGEEDAHGFLDVETLSRLDIMHAVFEDALESRNDLANVVAESAEKLDKARRRAKIPALQECDRQVHGEPVGFDLRGRAYYTVSNDVRLFRADKTAPTDEEDPSWSTPYVSLEEVSNFARALKHSRDKRELALHEFLTKDHLPFHLEKSKEDEEQAQRIEAKRLAREKEEAKKLAWEMMDRKRSSRLEKKQVEAEAKRETTATTISAEETEDVLSALRTFILSPFSIRGANGVPPHGIPIEQLYASGGAPARRKPKGRQWRNLCLSVLWDTDKPEDENSWYDAVVLDYDAAKERMRLYYPSTESTEVANLDHIPCRVGPKAPNGLFSTTGPVVYTAIVNAQLAEGFERARKGEAGVWSGTWRDDIVGAGVPGWGEGKLLLDIEKPAIPEIDDDDDVEDRTVVDVDATVAEEANEIDDGTESESIIETVKEEKAAASASDETEADTTTTFDIDETIVIDP